MHTEFLDWLREWGAKVPQVYFSDGMGQTLLTRSSHRAWALCNGKNPSGYPRAANPHLSLYHT